jgi:tetratricopeptide (TPR) repeat protein
MNNDHLDEWAFIAFLDSDAEMLDLAKAREHLASCSSCAHELEEFRSMYTALRDQEVWSLVDGSERITVPEDIRFLHARMSHEAKTAEQMLAVLTGMPVSEWIEFIAARPADWSSGLMKAIASAARAEMDRDASRALAMIDTGLWVAQRSRYATESIAVGDLWKERANALLELGRYPEALDALQQAEAAFELQPVPAFDLALVNWARANVLFRSGSYREAEIEVADAISVLDEYGDVVRVAQARVLKAGLRYAQGHFAEAKAQWLALQEVMEQLGDRSSLARIRSNVACCDVLLGDLPAARQAAAEALRTFDEAGMRTEMIRTRWAFARILMKSGYADAALDELTQAAADFDVQQMAVDAARVRLDIVAELLRRTSWSEARELAASLVEEFATRRTAGSELQALLYLQRAVENESATPETAQFVSEFLDAPTETFTPRMM